MATRERYPTGEDGVVGEELRPLLNADGDVVGVVSPSGRIAPIPLVTTDANGNTVLLGPDGQYLIYAGKVKKSNLLTRSITGRFAAASLAGSNHTTSLEFVLAAQYDRVRILLPNMHTAAIDNVKVAFAPTATQHGATQTAGGSAANSLVTPSGGVGTWVDATFSGGATGSLTASDGTTPTFTATDWMDVQSLARSDGGAGSLALVRIEIPSASGYRTSPFAGDNLSQWANTASVGDRTYRAVKQAVLGVTTKALCTSYGWDGYHQAAVIQYESRVKGVTVATFGDSITDGGYSGLTPYCYTWGHQASESVSSSTFPVEFCNAGWPTKDSNEFFDMATLIMPLVKPGIVFWAAFTPNLTLDANGIRDMRRYTSRMKALAQDYDTVLVMWTGIPSTYGLAQGKDWSAGADAMRVAYNTEIMACGDAVCDMASVMTGGFNATNTAQYDIISGASTDGLHPNTAGVEIMAGKAAETMNWLGIHS
jgi:lysophospholipase L1-like esterase